MPGHVDSLTADHGFVILAWLLSVTSQSMCPELVNTG